jgi:hypothetical protein
VGTADKQPADRAASRDSLPNPESLDYFVDFAEGSDETPAS